MKNIYLTLVLLLTVSFTFAGSSSKDLYSVNNFGPGCVTVYTSCGINGMACGAANLQDLIEMAITIEEMSCPQQ